MELSASLALAVHCLLSTATANLLENISARPCGVKPALRGRYRAACVVTLRLTDECFRGRTVRGVGVRSLRYVPASSEGTGRARA